jgi:hypothetical protein
MLNAQKSEANSRESNSDHIVTYSPRHNENDWASLDGNDWPSLTENPWPTLGESAWTIIAR